MNEQEFRSHVENLGYRESQIIELEPDNDGKLHTHNISSVGWVVRGSVRLEFERSEVVNGPGEFCEVDAGVLHCERAGPEGATVLLFWKRT
jgi:mannose-6-phosphate isomerase-like protein (cupin superfamily)